MARLTINLLGPFQVTLDEVPVTDFRSDKVRALLAYLAMEVDRPHRREALAGLLWPDMPDQTARKNLRLSIHRLRTAIGSQSGDSRFLTVDRESVQLNQADCWVDVAAFNRLLEQANRHTHSKLDSCEPCINKLEEAAALFRGDFLQGFYLDDSLAFSEWALLERESLHRRVLNVLHNLAAYYHRSGQNEFALGYAWRQLELEPWREEAHRQVMETLARRGERSAALAQYEACGRILAEELGVEPSEVTRALYERIRTMEIVSRHNLPAQSTAFIGRKAELSGVIKLLSNPECRMLTVVGPGGVGKTRLAIEAARARLDSYIEGVFFVPLAQVSSIDLLIATIADAIQISYSGAESPLDQLLDELRQKEVLLVLDNFEHLLSLPSSGAEILVEVLKNCSKVQLMITSRERLNLGWEWVYEIVGLKYPAVGDESIDAPDHYPALQLYKEKASRANQRFSFSSRTITPTSRICQLLEGMPLGIEIAAAWEGTLSTGEIAQEVEQNLDFLQSSLRDFPERHRSLRATFESSWRLLLREDQNVLSALSIFRHGFQREAAEAVAGASRHVLKSLVDKSLLRFEPPGRYALHEMLRQYAAEKMAERPEDEAIARARHCSYFSRFMKSREGSLSESGAAKALATIKVELDNVRAAWVWAVDHESIDEIERCLGSLAQYYLLRGPYQEGETLIKMAVERISTSVSMAGEAGDVEKLLLGKLRTREARFLNKLAQYERAISVAQASIELAKTQDADKIVALGHIEWGHALWNEGDHDGANSQFEIAYQITKDTDYRQEEADSLRCLGVIAFEQGEFDKAEAYYQHALPICRGIGDMRGEAALFNNLGLVAWTRGYFDRAKEHLQAALVIYHEVGDRQIEQTVLHNLGRLATQQGEYARARIHFNDALCIAISLGNRQYEGWGYLNLGLVAMELGDYTHARQECEKALHLFRLINSRQGELITLIYLGGIYRQLGVYSDAMACLEKAQSISREIGDTRNESLVVNFLGDLFSELGDFDSAHACLEQALSFHRDIGDRHSEGWGLIGLGLLYYRMGDDEKALEKCQLALQVSLDLSIGSLQAAAVTCMGHALVGLDHRAEAIDQYQLGVSLFKKLGKGHLAMEPIAGLAQLHLADVNYERAQAKIEEIIHFLESGTLDGTDDPVHIYLICYQVLRANGDPRTSTLLKSGYQELQSRASRITSAEQRRIYLELPIHREIRKIWEAESKKAS